MIARIISFSYYLYNCLNASVLKVIEEPDLMNCAEERVYRYLVTFIGNSKPNQLSLFLRFVTGNSVLIAKPIHVTFNNLTGLSRCPISTLAIIQNLKWTFLKFSVMR